MIAVFGLPGAERLISVSHDSELRLEWRDILYIRLVAVKAVMDAMAHKNFVAIADLPAPGDQRFRQRDTTEYLRLKNTEERDLQKLRNLKQLSMWENKCWPRSEKHQNLSS